MASSSLDLFDGIIPFLATAEARSFGTAAKQLGVGTSAVSKAVARLEAELGVRLLHRTARNVSLTTEGETFLARCRVASAAVQAGREEASSRATPRGRLRVSMPTRIGRRVLAALPNLLDRYPLLSIQAVITDRFVQLADENVDVAIRIGAVDDSRDVVMHRLRTSRWVTAASPRYLRRCGTPRSPSDLVDHACLRFVMQSGRPQDWRYVVDGKAHAQTIDGRIVADDGDALVAAAIAGLGLVYAPDFLIGDELAAGDLVEVLQPHAPAGPDLSVLSPPGRRGAANVRAFVGLVREVIGARATKPRKA